MMALSMDQVEKDMCGAADFLASQPGFEGPGVGAVGFCLGGGLAVWAAATCPNIAAAVTYYYVMPHGKPDFTQIDGPVLGHFGTADEFIPLEDANKLESELRDAGVDVDLPLLRGRRARLLQRHQPPGHLRRGPRPDLVGAHRELPALGARLLSVARQAPARPANAALSRLASTLASRRARRRGRARRDVAVARGVAPRMPRASATASPQQWSPPATLSACAGAVARRGWCSRATARATPPAPGAIVWSASSALRRGRRGARGGDRRRR